MKKVLSFALAIVMLLSCFTAAFAAVDNAACKIEIVPKETTYKAGDIVTFDVNLETAECLGLLGHIEELKIGFNNEVFEFVEAVTDNPTFFDKQQTIVYEGYPLKGYIVPTNCLIRTVDTSILTEDEVVAKGWNQVLRIAVTPDVTVDPAENCSAGKTYFSFKLKVKDTATAGTYSVGVVENGRTKVNEEQGAIEEDPELAEILGVAKVFQLVDANVTVASPATPIPTSILNPGKSQIRFNKNADGTYANTFAVRQLAVISGADFKNTFGETPEAQKAAIAEVGYVFARTSAVATFDVDTAKALIKNGTAAAGYTKLTVDYITTKADLVGEGNYGFSCIVDKIPAADNGDGVYALAYIKGTDGTFHYYPSAAPTPFNDLYTRNYSTAFPG